jgi:uncharacterized protein (TIGR00297 family)
LLTFTMFECIIGALALAAAFSALSFRLKLLTHSGAAAAAVLGTVILGLGGWAWILSLLAFFISSSLLSKARKHQSKAPEEAKGSRRDAVQVLANGGLAGAILLAQRFLQVDLYPAYLGALAAVNADTWSTEIGMMLGRNPRSIVTSKAVVAGTSGGVTLYGLMGALLGAILIAAVGKLTAPQGLTSSALLLIMAAGFSGSVFDSLLGATLQEKRRCRVCGKTTEILRHCEQSTERIGGIPGLNNDAVNFLCGVLGAAIAFLI